MYNWLVDFLNIPSDASDPVTYAACIIAILCAVEIVFWIRRAIYFLIGRLRRDA